MPEQFKFSVGSIPTLNIQVACDVALLESPSSTELSVEVEGRTQEARIMVLLQLILAVLNSLVANNPGLKKPGRAGLGIYVCWLLQLKIPPQLT